MSAVETLRASEQPNAVEQHLPATGPEMRLVSEKDFALSLLERQTSFREIFNTKFLRHSVPFMVREIAGSWFAS